MSKNKPSRKKEKIFPPPSRVRPSMCMPVTPAVSYLLLGLQDVQWAVGNSRGARKLARTPHVNKKKEKKRKKEKIIIQDDSILELALGIQCTVPKRSHWNSHHTTSRYNS